MWDFVGTTIAQSLKWLLFGMDDRGNVVRYPAGQIRSAVHLACYSLGARQLWWPGLEADQSFPSSADVRNVWWCKFSLPHAFVVYTGKHLLLWCLSLWNWSVFTECKVNVVEWSSSDSKYWGVCSIECHVFRKSIF